MEPIADGRQTSTAWDSIPQPEHPDQESIAIVERFLLDLHSDGLKINPFSLRISPCNHPPERDEQNTQNQISSTSRPQSTPPRQYTTVGSVYNPQPQPLQPPIRRGRAAKPLFSYNSESTPSHPPPRYTPLQQNSDRAISPARVPPWILSFLSSDHAYGLLAYDSREETLAGNGAPQPLAEASIMRDGDTGVIRQQVAKRNARTVVDTAADSDGEVDERITGAISRMNINSLVNLASYPNPMQRAAQKKLASHRAPPEPLTAASEVKAGGFNAQAEPWLPSSLAGTRLSSLATGSGAPAPLTAGPPGVRQPRPAILGQDSLQGMQRSDPESRVDFGYPSATPHVQTNGNAVPDAEKISPTKLGGIVDNPDYREGTVSTKTATANDVPDTKKADDEWFHNRLAIVECQDNPFLVQSRPEFQFERKERINKLWYGGNNMYSTTFDVAVAEHYHRCVTHTVCAPYQEPPKNQGKVEHRPLSVQDASIIPTSEHAVPLVSMAFQALANRPEISPYSHLPKFEQSLHPDYFKK